MRKRNRKLSLLKVNWLLKTCETTFECSHRKEHNRRLATKSQLKSQLALISNDHSADFWDELYLPTRNKTNIKSQFATSLKSTRYWRLLRRLWSVLIHKRRQKSTQYWKSTQKPTRSCIKWLQRWLLRNSAREPGVRAVCVRASRIASLLKIRSHYYDNWVD